MNNNNTLITFNGFINALLANRTNSRAMKASTFKTKEHFQLWKATCNRLLKAAYDVRIAKRQGIDAIPESTLYAFDIAFDCLTNYFKRGNIQQLRNLDMLKDEILALSVVILKDKEEVQEGKLPQIKGEITFRKDIEILLADRVLGKEYRSADEQLRLKAERAARRKAKREAAKAAKKAAAEAAQNSEVVETFKGEIVDVVEVLALPNKA